MYVDEDSRLKTQDSRLKTQDSRATETFAEWLVIHKIDLKILQQLSLKFPTQIHSFDEQVACLKISLSADEAWDVAAKSLIKLIPVHAQAIKYIQKESPKCLSQKKDKSKRPYTIDQNNNELPFVSCFYTGSIPDLMDVAHEFAHAVQIYLSKEHQVEGASFMLPMPRECCAFLGEIALLDYYKQENSKIYKGLQQKWRNDNLKYLSADVSQLRQALEDNELSYTYDWNYPIARLYALMLRRQACDKKTNKHNEFEELFASGKRAVDRISILQLVKSLPISNPLPRMPEPVKNLSKCQVLGAVTALYMLKKHPQVNSSDLSVGRFYEKISKHLKERTVFIHFLHGKPVGYALWSRETKRDKTIRLIELCTPFIEQKKFMGVLQNQYKCTVKNKKNLLNDQPLDKVA